MSNISIRRALETAITDITPSIETSWENVSFNPINDIPYQIVNLFFSTPVNPTIGGAGNTILTRQQGFIQITLVYPLGTGTVSLETRAELIKTSFKRGSSFINSGQTVIIKNTPEISNVGRDADRWRINVKIPFYANVFL